MSIEAQLGGSYNSILSSNFQALSSKFSVLSSPEAGSLLDVPLIAGSRIGIVMFSYFDGHFLAEQLLGIKIFASLGMNANGCVKRQQNRHGGRGGVEALRNETVLILHASGEKRNTLVLTGTFLNIGYFNRMAAIGQEAFVLTFFNLNFHGSLAISVSPLTVANVFGFLLIILAMLSSVYGWWREDKSAEKLYTCFYKMFSFLQIC